jgi:hypothetical protein
MAEAEERVCPRCGSPADDNAYCPECGFDLRSQGELPTRSQWVQERQTAPTETPGTPPPQRETPVSPTPAAGAERRSLLRPVPLLILGGVLVAAAVVVIIVVSSGGGGGLSRADVESRLEGLLAATPYGVENPSVECPEEIEIETGKKVECHATAADGTTAPVQATVESTSGEGRFTIENLIATESIGNECAKEMTEFAHEFGIAAGTCEVTCPELVQAMPNGHLTCAFTIPEEGRGGHVHIGLGPDGKTAEGPWHANEESSPGASAPGASSTGASQ